MSLIKFECGACRSQIVVEATSAGKRGKCDKCGEIIRIPDADNPHAEVVGAKPAEYATTAEPDRRKPWWLHLLDAIGGLMQGVAVMALVVAVLAGAVLCMEDRTMGKTNALLWLNLWMLVVIAFLIGRMIRQRRS